MPKPAPKKPCNKPIPSPAPPKPKSQTSSRSPAASGKPAASRASSTRRSTPGQPRPTKPGTAKSSSSRAAPPPVSKTTVARWRNWKTVLLISPAILLLGFCSLVGFLDGYGQRDRARAADAIVVLGARVGTNGIAGQVLRERTLHAVQLYKRGIAPKIIFTGGVGAHRISEAQAAATLARKHGVAPRDIVLESRSTSTWENARFTSWICKERGWQQVVVVSDPYHLWRARRDFKQAGLAPFISPATEWQKRYPTRRVWAAAREAVLVLRDLVVRP